MKSINQHKEFSVNNDSYLKGITDFIRDMMLQAGADKAEIIRTELLSEEMVEAFIMHASGDDRIIVRVKRFFGDTVVSLQMNGNEFDPFEYATGSIGELDDNSEAEYENVIRSILLKAYGEDFKYSNKNHSNRIMIIASRSEKSMVTKTLIALTLGLIFGFLAKMILPVSMTDLSALSVTNSAFSLILATTIAFNLSTTTICSLFYGEEDKKGIEVAFKQSVKVILTIFAVAMIVVVVFANILARLFLKSGDVSELNTATFFIRCMIIQYFIMCASYSFTGAYQGIRLLKLNYIMVFLRETAMPVICVFIFGKLFGIRGVGAGFITAGIFSLILCFLLPAVIKRKIPVKTGDFILIDDDFGSKAEDTFETSVSDMEGVIDTSTRVAEFYKAHGIDKRTTFHVSLFLEEMLRNVIEHGYKDNREKCVDIRVICEENRQVIRIRDNGVPFDPLEWYKRNNPEDPASGLGIRMVMALAKDVRYVPSMELNNIMLTL